MTRSAAHAALRVSDIERSTRYYATVFDGKLELSASVPAEIAASSFGVPDGTTAVRRLMTFGSSFAIELYEFSPAGPIPPVDQGATGLMHICLAVTDVIATLSKVEEAGGKARFPVRAFGNYHAAFTTDPDGHVVEVLDAPLEACVRQANGSNLPTRAATVADARDPAATSSTNHQRTTA
jgi:catechol 2,3-dioxygenase-like lactoylglutathione lyase family enzyme